MHKGVLGLVDRRPADIGAQELRMNHATHDPLCATLHAVPSDRLEALIRELQLRLPWLPLVEPRR